MYRNTLENKIDRGSLGVLVLILSGAMASACASDPPPRSGRKIDWNSRDPIPCDRDQDCPGPTMCGPCDERPLTPPVINARPECVLAVCNEMHVWCTEGHVCWEAPGSRDGGLP